MICGVVLHFSIFLYGRNDKSELGRSALFAFDGPPSAKQNRQRARASVRRGLVDESVMERHLWLSCHHKPFANASEFAKHLRHPKGRCLISADQHTYVSKWLVKYRHCDM